MSMRHFAALKTFPAWLGLCMERAILTGFHPLNCAIRFREESGIYIKSVGVFFFVYVHTVYM